MEGFLGSYWSQYCGCFPTHNEPGKHPSAKVATQGSVLRSHRRRLLSLQNAKLSVASRGPVTQTRKATPDTWRIHWAGTQVKEQESRYSADLTPSMHVTGSLQFLKAQKAAFSPPHFSHCVIYLSLCLLCYIWFFKSFRNFLLFPFI